MPYVWDKLKTKRLPTIAQAMEAIRIAQIEDDAFRDTRPLMCILQRLDSTHLRLSGHIMRRISTAFSTSWDIAPTEETTINGKTTEELAKEAKRRLKKVIRDLTYKQINAVKFGKLLLEYDWLPVGEWKIPTLKKVYLPTDTERNLAYPQGIAILEHDNSTALFNRKAIDPTQQDRFISELFDMGSGEDGGVYLAIVFHAIHLHNNNQKWVSFNGRLQGIVQGKYKRTAQPPEREAARRATENVGESNRLFTSEDIDFEFHRMVDAVGAQSYRALKEELQSDIAIAICGNPNTTEISKGSGSRAAIETLSLSEDDVAAMDRMRFAETLINEQLLKYDFRHNVAMDFDYNEELPYQFVFPEKYTEDHLINSEVILNAKRAGVPIPVAEAYRKMGIRAPEEGEEVLATTGTETMP